MAGWEGFFVTHSRTSGTHSHSRLVQEIAQERETNGDEEMRVYERQRCHREQGTPRRRAGLGASGFPFSANTPFMPRFIPPWRPSGWLGSHGLPPPSWGLLRDLLLGGKREMLSSHKNNELRKSSGFCLVACTPCFPAAAEEGLPSCITSPCAPLLPILGLTSTMEPLMDLPAHAVVAAMSLLLT